jgi:hypothetical protein
MNENQIEPENNLFFGFDLMYCQFNFIKNNYTWSNLIALKYTIIINTKTRSHAYQYGSNNASSCWILHTKGKSYIL